MTKEQYAALQEDVTKYWIALQKVDDFLIRTNGTGSIDNIEDMPERKSAFVNFEYAVERLSRFGKD
jgi:hypothetical protein